MVTVHIFVCSIQGGSPPSRGAELPVKQDGCGQLVDGDGANHRRLLFHRPHRGHVRVGKTEKRHESSSFHLG